VSVWNTCVAGGGHALDTQRFNAIVNWTVAECEKAG
jgi:hypothetical protein